jgi:hypothetical protein
LSTKKEKNHIAKVSPIGMYFTTNIEKTAIGIAK